MSYWSRTLQDRLAPDAPHSPEERVRTVPVARRLIAAHPPGTRSKADIDRQIREEHDAWGNGCVCLDASCLVYPIEAASPRPDGPLRGSRRVVPWYPRDVNHPGLDAYKIVLYRQDDGSWVAE